LPRPKEYRLMRVDKCWDATTSDLSDQEKRIINDKVMNGIRLNPYDSEPLKKELEGLYSYNKIESGNRIVFAICYECRRGGFTKVNNCTDCKSIENDVVKLFGAGRHDELYEFLGRKRKSRIGLRQ
jgi:Txe/YoeB family toxin of Txe-Axe toxin-antitoxin module